MSVIRQRRRKGPQRRVGPLEQLATEPFPTADLVLLCNFGADLTPLANRAGTASRAVFGRIWRSARSASDSDQSPAVQAPWG